MSIVIPEYVLYHANCCDGFGSAFAVWKYLNSINVNCKRIKFIPVKYGDYPPSEMINSSVYILDFCYPKVVMDYILGVNKYVLVIDHHKTSKPIADEYKNGNCIKFIHNQEHSAAYLTWKYLFGDSSDAPLLILYIEARDIWRKSLLPNVDAFAAWFFTLPHDFEEYDKYLDSELLNRMIYEKGLAYEELNLSNIKKEKISIKLTLIGSKYYMVGYSSSPLRSDMGSYIMKTKNVDFAAIFGINHRENTTSFSLRSTDNKTDVSEIAKFFGGGGHRNASGCTIPFITNTLGVVLHDNKLYQKIIDKKREYKEQRLVMMEYEGYEKELGRYFTQNENFDYAIIWHVDATDIFTYFRVIFSERVTLNKILELRNKLELDSKNECRLEGIHSLEYLKDEF